MKVYCMDCLNFDGYDNCESDNNMTTKSTWKSEKELVSKMKPSTLNLNNNCKWYSKV